MPRVAAILRFSAALLLCCGCLPSVSAQMAPPEAARKFDEFGRIHHCDLTARLDNLAIFVESTPGAKAHLISYAPPGTGEELLRHIKNYLITTRRLKAQQIKTTYAGRNIDLTQAKIELWIVPKNGFPPEPQKYETNVERFKGLLADERASDYIELTFDESMDPGIGDTVHSSFSDILKQQKNALGYLVVYSGESATPGAWQRIAQNQIDYLKHFDVDPSRVKVIFGGHQKQTRRQFWIVPKDAPPPVRDAGPELPFAKTVKVGDFYAGTLSDPQNETKVFTRLKEILKAQKSGRAFLVVRLEAPAPDEAPVVDGPEPADLTKLVENWRAEFANTHNIGADRVIVLFTTAPEFQASHLRLWIVPKGQPLPDPHEEDETEDDP